MKLFYKNLTCIRVQTVFRALHKSCSSYSNKNFLVWRLELMVHALRMAWALIERWTSANDLIAGCHRRRNQSGHIISSQISDNQAVALAILMIFNCILVQVQPIQLTKHILDDTQTCVHKNRTDETCWTWSHHFSRGENHGTTEIWADGTTVASNCYEDWTLAMKSNFWLFSYLIQRWCKLWL